MARYYDGGGIEDKEDVTVHFCCFVERDVPESKGKPNASPIIFPVHRPVYYHHLHRSFSFLYTFLFFSYLLGMYPNFLLHLSCLSSPPPPNSTFFNINAKTTNRVDSRYVQHPHFHTSFFLVS